MTVYRSFITYGPRDNTPFGWKIYYGNHELMFYGASGIPTARTKSFSTEAEASRDRRHAGWNRNGNNELWHPKLGE